jgi:hypothetical protein
MSPALLCQGRCISLAPSVGDLLWYSDLSSPPPRKGPQRYRSEDLPYGAAQLVCTPWDELLELKNPKTKELRSVYVGTIQRPNNGPRLVGLRLESIVQKMTEHPLVYLKFYAYVVRPGSAGTDPSIEAWDQSTGALSFEASSFRIFADSRDRSDPGTLLFYCELDNRARLIEVKLGADGSIKAGWRPATSEPLGPFAP